MFCNQCGEENRNDRKFCASCGAPLRDYTKPRENLIMHEEIERKQEAVKTKNKVCYWLNLSTWICFVIALIFTICWFFVPNTYQLLFSTFGIIFYVATIVLMIIYKSFEIKKNKTISGNTKNKKDKNNTVK